MKIRKVSVAAIASALVLGSLIVAAPSFALGSGSVPIRTFPTRTTGTARETASSLRQAAKSAALT